MDLTCRALAVYLLLLVHPCRAKAEGEGPTSAARRTVRADRLRAEVRVVTGFDSNIDQSRENVPSGGVLELNGEASYSRHLGHRWFGLAEVDLAGDLRGGSRSASRFEAGATLGLVHFLVGQGRFRGAGPREPGYPRLRIGVSVDYFFGLSLDDAQERRVSRNSTESGVRRPEVSGASDDWDARSEDGAEGEADEYDDDDDEYDDDHEYDDDDDEYDDDDDEYDDDDDDDAREEEEDREEAEEDGTPVDTNRFDVSGQGSVIGPSFVFLAPFHQLSVESELVFWPWASTRLMLTPRVMRAFVTPEPGEVAGDFNRLDVGAGVRQDVGWGFEVGGGYQVEFRRFDQRLNRRGETVQDTTHRTELFVSYEYRSLFLRSTYDLRYRLPNREDRDTVRHTLSLQVAWLVDNAWALIGELATTHQERIGRRDRSWNRQQAVLGVELRY